MYDNYINVVVVKHPNCAIPYTFKVPDYKRLYVGDYVLCDTKQGPNQMAQCITPSFFILEDYLFKFYGVKASNLKRITAELTPKVFVYKQEVQHGEEGQSDNREQV